SETFKRKIGTQDKNTVSLNLSTNLTFSRLLDAVCGVFVNKIKLRSHVWSSVINYLSGSN
ncbi:hypothetical protein PN476_07370, partial [Dolichospermum circinale CS-537/05]|nr:hypothetical protein [Dolichospermum circinale CS-537/05]